MGFLHNNVVYCDDSVAFSRLQDFILDDMRSFTSNLFYEFRHVLLNQFISLLLEIVSDFRFGVL